MEGQENDELLPAGWRVEVRVRKNGKKDKVIIEKAAAEGLPPGWIKEIRVTKTGNKVRRDPVYIDPVSGYFFRSMRDAVRYLETGEIGRLAYKPKDKGSNDGSHDEDLEEDKDDSPMVAKKQKLATPGAETQITSQSMKSNEVAEDEDALNSASPGECVSLSEHASDHGGVGTALSSSNLPEAKESNNMDLPEAKESNNMDGEKDSDKSKSLSTSAVGVSTDRQSSENGEIRDETKKAGPGKSRSKNKKVLNLPRRASKRLAGLALDPTPELKTSNRARRTVAKQSGDIGLVEGSCSGSLANQASERLDQPEDKPKSNHFFDTYKSTEDSLESSKSKHPSQDPNEHPGKVETDYGSNKKQGSSVVSPLRNKDIVETDNKADVKPGPSLDLPFGDLLSDPCIAFAIKTLTGETFESSDGTTEVSLGSDNSKFEVLATSEEHAGSQKEENESVEKQNPAIPREVAENVDCSYKTDEKLGLPLDLPFADIWRDPCIEFAIKTLTSTNPVGFDPDIQEYFQQQLNSPQTQTTNNFYQTEYLCQQYDVLDKHVSRQQASTGNVSLQSSGGTSLHQHGEKRFNECH